MVMTFRLNESLSIKQICNQKKPLASFDCLKSFLQRDPELSIGKSEGVSLARSQGENKAEI